MNWLPCFLASLLCTSRVPNLTSWFSCSIVAHDIVTVVNLLTQVELNAALLEHIEYDLACLAFVLILRKKFRYYEVIIEGWWSSSCHGPVAEHWWLKARSVLGLTTGDCQPFHFPLKGNSVGTAKRALTLGTANLPKLALQ